MSFVYKNPTAAAQLAAPYGVSRTSTQGTTFSISLVGGYTEVWNLDDLSLTFSGNGLQQLSANTIPIQINIGNNTGLSWTTLTLNSDNISSGRRRLGMQVFVQETETVYQYSIPNYETLWDAVAVQTGSSGFTIDTNTTTVQYRTQAGRDFINAWTGSTIEGQSGTTRENARWKIFYGTDVQITGGTYDSQNTELSLNNSTGGTITITGFAPAVTGGTYNSGTQELTLYTTDNNDVVISGFTSGGGSPLTVYNATSGVTATNVTGMTFSGASVVNNGGGNVLISFSGGSGTSGTSGTSGSSGTSGTSGTSGSSGTSGTRGTSGTSGTSGINVGSSAVIILGSGTFSSVRCGVSNVASGNCSAALGGTSNMACGNYSTVSGGYCNIASGSTSTIGGGYCNTASGDYYSTVSGGYCNSASGSCSFLGGGGFNFATGTNSTIGGGYCNSVSGDNSFIGGGNSNSASGSTSTIGGGYNNSTRGNCSTISGGYGNIGFGTYSTIGGGQRNCTCGNNSTIAGGLVNFVNACYSTIGGGCCNKIFGVSSFFSTIGGGNKNSISGSTSTIGGGYKNTVSGDYSTIGGGNCNTISGDSSSLSTISGGFCNVSSESYTTVSGGYCNTASGSWSTIGGGYCNTATGIYSTIIGGDNNIASGNYSAAGGDNVSNSCCKTFMYNCLRACNLSGSTVAVCVGTDGILVRGASDVRLKTCISPITYGLNDVLQLNPVSFNWCENIRQSRGENKQLGFIAQEVEPIIPESVGMSAEGEYSFSPDKIIPVLTKAIQELKEENNKLREENINIKIRIEKLEEYIR
jgi:hypothetical protein